jgi:hypothetical protein
VPEIVAQPGKNRPSYGNQIDAAYDLLRKHDHCRANAILLCLKAARDVAALEKRNEMAVNARFGSANLLGEFRHAQSRPAFGKRLHDAKSQRDGKNTVRQVGAQCYLGHVLHVSHWSILQCAGLAILAKFVHDPIR